MERTGVVVRAGHDRCLDSNTAHLWEYLSTQPIQFYQEVELPATAKRQARTAKLAVRFSLVQLRRHKLAEVLEAITPEQIASLTSYDFILEALFSAAS